MDSLLPLQAPFESPRAWTIAIPFALVVHLVALGVFARTFPEIRFPRCQVIDVRFVERIPRCFFGMPPTFAKVPPLRMHVYRQAAPAEPGGFHETGWSEHGQWSEPRKLSGPDPEYSDEAIDHQVEGTAVVVCRITVDGSVQNCRVVKSLPYLDPSVVAALQARHYSPAMFENTPVDIDYTFRVHFSLPSL